LNLLLGALFFLSGALGLLYEIVWFRRLHLALGVNTFAVGAVVSAFMLGLAAGSRWASRSGWLRRSPLAAYAGLEMGIALYALAFPVLVGGLEALYPTLFRVLEGHFLTLSAARFALAFVLLLPPTFLMGASLPAIAEAAVAVPGELARRVAWLYALNTLGGVAGTLAAGFLLIERLGLVRSLFLGAAGSALVAAAALALSRRRAHRPPEPTEEPIRKRKRSDPSPRQPLAALATTAALAAGAVSLACEVVWTRALVFFVHNSTYAFSAIVAVYLLGIAAGAALAARLARTTGDTVRLLAGTLLASSASLVGAIAVYRHLPALAAALAGGRSLAPGVSGAADTSSMLVWSWTSALVVIFGQVAAVLFLPALFLGAVFPLSLGLAAPDAAPAAERVGRLYAANAVGSVLGAVLGTFAFVALLGTRGALLLLAWLPVPVALWALRETSETRRVPRLTAGLALAALAGGSLLAAPPGFYRELFEKRFGRVLWFAEGVSETVAVCEYRDGSRWIQFSDGRGASGTWSFPGGWLYAHLPLLLHPRPQSAAVLCFGTGNTLGAASLHPLASLDGVELSPDVVRAAPFFAKTNHDVVRSGKARILIEDGRNFLLATAGHYDVISEEPPLVHTAGVVNLYSRDFYELVARRLTDDGIAAVWLATWELEPSELRMLVRAFTDAFPYASAWDCTHPYEWLLIGAKKAPRVDLDLLAAKMAEPAIARDLARIDVEAGGIRTPADLLSLHLMGREAMVAFAGSAAPVTDDRSVVDFTTPRHARANFGLGEWVTGGLSASGVGEHGLRSELGLREFDRIYAFREPVRPLVASYGARDPERFAQEVKERMWVREMRAARMTVTALKRLAGDLRATGRPERCLESLDRGLALVPFEASAPIQAMRAQVYRELGRINEARAAEADEVRALEALARRSVAAPGQAAPAAAGDER
jgi:predicted membrane-bound spermidine synthase